MLEPILLTIAATAAKDMLGRLTWHRASDGSLQAISTSGHKVEFDEGQLKKFDRQIAPPSPLRKMQHAPDDRTPFTEGALALSDSDHFFGEARRRVNLVFRIHLGVSLLIATLLVITVSGAVISLALGSNLLAAGLGTTTLASLLGAGLYKPLDKIRQALVDAQRLDAIHLMTKQQLSGCEDQDAKTRFKSQERIWKEILSQLATLEQSVGGSKKESGTG